MKVWGSNHKEPPAGATGTYNTINEDGLSNSQKNTFRVMLSY